MRDILLLLIILICFCRIGAEIVIIGNGNVINQGLPWEPIAGYNYTQTVYLASEIGTPGVIGSIGYYYTVYSSLFFEHNRALTIWMGHSASDSLTAWIQLDQLTQVYSGQLSTTDFSSVLPGNGILTINLDDPFNYNGTDNLIIAIHEYSPGGSNTSDDFYSTNSSRHRARKFASMSIDPDPANPPLSPVTNLTYAANLRLDMTTMHYTPYQPEPQNQSQNIPIDTGLSWESDATEFDVYFGTNAANLQPVSLSTVLHEWIPSEPLSLLTTYYWKINARYDDSFCSGPVWSFTTAGEALSPPRNLSGYYNGSAIQLNWQAPQMGSVDHYILRRNSIFLTNCPDTSWQDAGVVPGNTYYYNVSAVNHLGQESTPSNTISVSIPFVDPNLILAEDWEGLPPFSHELGDWLSLDEDGYATWTPDNTSFPGSGEPAAWISFAPQQTSPPLTGITPHGGSQMLACFSSLTPPNQDWLISPRLFLGTGPQLSFFARSHTADFGLERLRVLISTTGSDPASFVSVNASPYWEIPAAWTEMTIDLSPWQGQSVRLALECVSWDALALYIDDIRVSGEGGSSVSDSVTESPGYKLYPNPSHGRFNLFRNDKQAFDLSIYDLRGRLVHHETKLTTFSSGLSGFRPAPGIYLIQATTATDTYRAKTVILP